MKNVDIVNIFPTKNQLNKEFKQYELYLFEEELKNILRSIIWAYGKGLKFIYWTDLSCYAHDFLLEKGYRVIYDTEYKGSKIILSD